MVTVKEVKTEFVRKIKFDDDFESKEAYWNLGDTLIEITYMYLKEYCRRTNYKFNPIHISEKDWEKILKEMVKGLEDYLTTDEMEITPEKEVELNKGVSRSFKLLSKHWQSLWY